MDAQYQKSDFHKKVALPWREHFLNTHFRNAECDCGHGCTGLWFFVFDVATVAENANLESYCFLSKDIEVNRNLQG